MTRCDQCNSDRTILRRERFITPFAVIGAVLAGIVGLAAGLLGPKQLVAHCGECGNRWRPKNARRSPI